MVRRRASKPVGVALSAAPHGNDPSVHMNDTRRRYHGARPRVCVGDTDPGPLPPQWVQFLVAEAEKAAAAPALSPKAAAGAAGSK